MWWHTVSLNGMILHQTVAHSPLSTYPSPWHLQSTVLLGAVRVLGPKNLCTTNGLSRLFQQQISFFPAMVALVWGGGFGTRPGGLGGGGWHKASVSDCLPLAAPIGLSPLLMLTLCGPERVLVVSTEPPDDLSCLTTPGVGRPGDGAVARAIDQVHPDAPSESMRGFVDSSTDLTALRCASAGSCS